MKLKNSLVVLMTLVLSATGLVLAHEGEDTYDHHGMMSGFFGGGMWGMGFFGWIFMILVIVILILFIAWLIKQLQKR